jgi:hypothetical protein
MNEKTGLILVDPCRELLEACKMAYRKHHLNDQSIGWDELSEVLLNALCNTMGDKGFNEWLVTAQKEGV